MTLTAHPSHQGSGMVRVRILADTICDPHGLVQKGDVVIVSFDEWHTLRTNGKAEIAIDEPKKPATFEELLAEVEAAGYKDEAAKALAQERFDGKFGDDARYLTPDEGEEIEVDELVEAIAGLTKAKLVVKAKEEFGLDLSEGSTKDALIAAIVAAAKKKSEAAEG